MYIQRCMKGNRPLSHSKEKQTTMPQFWGQTLLERTQRALVVAPKKDGQQFELHSRSRDLKTAPVVWTIPVKPHPGNEKIYF